MVSEQVLEKVQSVTRVELKSDIVVIGGGGTGLCAAVAAAEKGAKVILLEKRGLGGNSALTGCISAVNSPLQKRLGINISADKVFREKMAHCDWRANARLVRNVINISGEIIQWLGNKGIESKALSTLTTA